MATMNISLPAPMRQWVEEQVATGRYANASDVMRDLIRREQDRTRHMSPEDIAAIEDALRHQEDRSRFVDHDEAYRRVSAALARKTSAA